MTVQALIFVHLASNSRSAPPRNAPGFDCSYFIRKIGIQVLAWVCPQSQACQGGFGILTVSLRKQLHKIAIKCVSWTLTVCHDYGNPWHCTCPGLVLQSLKHDSYMWPLENLLEINHLEQIITPTHTQNTYTHSTHTAHTLTHQDFIGNKRKYRIHLPHYPKKF